MKKPRVEYVMALFAAVLLAGCGGQNNTLWDDIEALKKENTDLSMQVQTLQQENDQLNEQVDTLSVLDKNTRLQNIDTLDKIRINKRTGLYDTDENGTKETLIVYVEPLDTAQDYVKAVGTVKVELWNLNSDIVDVKLADWTLEPTETQKFWGGNIFASYYRLPFEIADILSGQEKELTVKVTFTDFFSGRVCRNQTTITVQ